MDTTKLYKQHKQKMLAGVGINKRNKDKSWDTYREVFNSIREILKEGLQQETSEYVEMLVHEIQPYMDFLYNIYKIKLDEADGDHHKLTPHIQAYEKLCDLSAVWQSEKNAIDAYKQSISFLRSLENYFDNRQYFDNVVYLAEKKYYSDLAFKAEDKNIPAFND